MVKYHHPYLVEQSGIVKLVQRWSMSSLNTHNVSIIIQPRECFPRHVPERLSRFLLPKKTGTTFQTVHSVHVEPGPSQRIQLHRLGIGIAVYASFVRHYSVQRLLLLIPTISSTNFLFVTM